MLCALEGKNGITVLESLFQNAAASSDMWTLVRVVSC